MPQRNTFTFESGITITSEFDSGNLLKCVEVQPEVAEHQMLEQIYKFEMWVSPDSWPYLPESTAGRAGFFFAASGFADEKV